MTNTNNEAEELFPPHLQRMILDIFSTTINLDHFDIFVFGSWAQGLQVKSSDIDIGITSKMNRKTVASEIDTYKIKELFLESNFPYLVDIVFFDSASKNFKDIALKHIIWLTSKDKK